MPKHISFLKDMTSHQKESSEGKDLTTFTHYVGPFGKNEKMEIANKSESNYRKSGKSY